MRKCFRSIIGLLVVMSVVFSVLPTTLVTAGSVFETEKVVEVENAFIVRNSTSYIQSEYASGGTYVVLAGDDIPLEKVTVSDVDLTFNIKKKGTYDTYVRVLFDKDTRDRFFVRWDHTDWSVSETGTTANAFKWVLADQRKLTAGNHKLSIAHGESNGWYDAVYICPKGMTPPEELEGVTSGKIKAGGYTLVHEQKELPVITDTYLFQAEDATIYAPFVIKAGKGASGSVVSPTKQKSPNRDVAPPQGSPGKVQFKFVAGKSAEYHLWLRIRIPARANQLIYFSYNGGSYSKVTLPITNDWEWHYLTSKKATEGQEAVFEFYERYKDLEIDSVLIKTIDYTPEGKDGLPPENFGMSDVELDTSTYTNPEILPPAFEHPRVLFTKDDIPRILENLEHPQNEVPVASYKEYLADDYDGTPNGREYWELPTLEAKAFDYALTGNKENGRKAVDGIIKYLSGYSLSSSNEATRDGGNIIFIASEIYDWCYDLLSVQERKIIIDACINLISGIEIGWPLREDLGSIIGHGCEAMFLKDILCFAIAVYDERPDIWDYVGARFYQEYVPVREWFNQAGYHHQGTSYGLYRHRWDTWAYFLITGMGAPEPYSGKDLAEMSYQIIYQRRPDGQYFRNGDTHQDSREKMWNYWSEHREIVGLDQAVIDDPYIKNELFRQNPFLEDFDSDYSENGSPITFLIRNNPNTEAESFTGLPQSRYFGSPVGLTIARTGWNDGVESPDAIAFMNVGEWRTNNHQHANSGAFQLYYKGILASRSGIYQGYTTSGNSNGSTGYSSEHVWMFASKSIAYNTMLIYDPSEPQSEAKRNNVSDGGQRATFSNGDVHTLSKYLNADSENHDANTGTVVAQEIDPKDQIKPAYTYLKGDITKAYLKRKCEHYDRSFMFLNLFDEKVPAALIVYDRVTSTNASFKKTWLLHTPEQPTINGKQIVAEKTLSSSSYDMGYNGKLIVDSLLPKNSKISVVGGEEEGWHTINGVDWTGLPAANKTTEGINYRIEISPEKAATTDHFLNVLQVTDAGTKNYLPVAQFETNQIYGVKIADRVVTFAKNTADLSQVVFDTTGGGTLKYTVCDVTPGTWEVTIGGNKQTVYVTEEGKVLAFDAPSGKISARKVSDETVVYEDANDQRLDTEREISVRLDGFFVYSEEKPQLVDGSLMMPISILEKYYTLKKSTDGDNVVYSNHIASINVPSENKGDTGYILKDNAQTPIKVFYNNGELMVPARAVVEAYGGTITWDNNAKTAFLTSPPKDYSKPEGYLNFKSVRKDPGRDFDVEEDNIIERAIDENVNTHWGAKGIGRYIEFELEEATNVENVEIVFNPNSGRNAAFEIQVSSDGRTWKTILVAAGDGTVEAGSWEKFVFDKPVKTKWIRYVANGSNKSEWNGVKEIRFKEAK